MSMGEQSTAQATAGISAAAAALGAAQEWALALFGVPLPVIFGAFAGAAYGVTFNKTMKPFQLFCSVVMTTIFASVAAPAITFISPVTGVQAAAAAAAGFLLQYGGPWLLENRQSVLDGLRRRFIPGGDK